MRFGAFEVFLLANIDVLVRGFQMTGVVLVDLW
jgi:hypothetical protein